MFWTIQSEDSRGRVTVLTMTTNDLFVAIPAKNIELIIWHLKFKKRLLLRCIHHFLFFIIFLNVCKIYRGAYDFSIWE